MRRECFVIPLLARLPYIVDSSHIEASNLLKQGKGRLNLLNKERGN